MENRTRRGRYIDLSKSPIEVCWEGMVFKFSTEKKREIFIKRVDERCHLVNRYFNKLYRITESGDKDFNLSGLYGKILQSVYNSMTHK